MAELAEEERELSAVIGGVVEGVMDELAESVGGGVEGARRVKLGLCEITQVARIGFVVRGPCALQSREVSIVIRCRAGDEVSRLSQLRSPQRMWMSVPWREAKLARRSRSRSSGVRAAEASRRRWLAQRL